jgi:hypothetical protein
MSQFNAQTKFDKQALLDQAKQLEVQRKADQKRMLFRKNNPNAGPEVQAIYDANIERNARLDSAANYGTGQGSASAKVADMMARERTAANDYRRNLTGATRGSEIAAAGQVGLDSAAQEQMRLRALTGMDAQNAESFAGTKRRDAESGAKVATLNEGVEDRRAFRPLEMGRMKVDTEGAMLDNQAVGQGNERRAMMLDLVPDEVAAQRAAFQRNRERSDAEAIAIANAPPTLPADVREADAKARFAELNVDAAAKAATSGIQGLTPKQAEDKVAQRRAMLELGNITPERTARTSQALEGISSQMSNLRRGSVDGSTFLGSGNPTIELASQIANELDDLEMTAARDEEGAAAASNRARELIEGLAAANADGEYQASVGFPSLSSVALGPIGLMASALNYGGRQKAASDLTSIRQRLEALRRPLARRQLPPGYRE